MIDLLNRLIPFIVMISVVLIPLGGIMGIILAVFMANEKDAAKKKKLMWYMIASFVAPIIILAGTVTLWGLLNVLVKANT